MKSKLFYLFASLMIMITLFFAVNISLKFYFNSFLYETPDLTNVKFEEAVHIADKGHLKLQEMGSDFSEFKEGHIFAQLPKPGSAIKSGRIIKIWTSKGEDKIILPDFSNFTLEDARIEIEKLGLTLQNISYTKKDNTPFNQVISSQPKKGTNVYRNQEISLLINIKTTGKLVRVPDLIGIELYEVERLLKSKKLILGSVSYIEDINLQSDVIVDMSINFGTEVPEGTVIDVTINR